MAKKSSTESRDMFLLSEKIHALISAKRYDEVRLLIDTERLKKPEGEAHRFTALSALLHESLGEIDESIAFMRQALLEKPAWIPHLYRLSVMLMDAERWYDADVVLKEIIALSLAKNDVYFLDDCRFRRVICLHMLGRADELEQVKAEVPAGMSAFIGDKLCRIEDILR